MQTVPSQPCIPRRSTYARPCGVRPRTARNVSAEGRHSCALRVPTHWGGGEGAFFLAPVSGATKFAALGRCSGRRGVDWLYGGPGPASSRLAPPLRISPPILSRIGRPRCRGGGRLSPLPLPLLPHQLLLPPPPTLLAFFKGPLPLFVFPVKFLRLFHGVDHAQTISSSRPLGRSGIYFL